jgi:hypothetical protein
MRFTQLCDKSAARLVSRPDVRLRLTFGPAILVTIQLILVEFPTTTRARETVISIMRFANLLVLLLSLTLGIWEGRFVMENDGGKRSKISGCEDAWKVIQLSVPPPQLW